MFRCFSLNLKTKQGQRTTPRAIPGITLQQYFSFLPLFIEVMNDLPNEFMVRILVEQFALGPLELIFLWDYICVFLLSL